MPLHLLVESWHARIICSFTGAIVLDAVNLRRTEMAGSKDFRHKNPPQFLQTEGGFYESIEPPSDEKPVGLSVAFLLGKNYKQVSLFNLVSLFKLHLCNFTICSGLDVRFKLHGLGNHQDITGFHFITDLN